MLGRGHRQILWWFESTTYFRNCIFQEQLARITSALWTWIDKSTTLYPLQQNPTIFLETKWFWGESSWNLIRTRPRQKFCSLTARVKSWQRAALFLRITFKAHGTIEMVWPQAKRNRMQWTTPKSLWRVYPLSSCVCQPIASDVYSVVNMHVCLSSRRFIRAKPPQLRRLNTRCAPQPHRNLTPPHATPRPPHEF